MNDKNKIVELLKNYRSCRYAISNGIAPFDEEEPGMPFNSSFGPRIPTLIGRGTWDRSIKDYREYSYFVRMIDGAVREVLDDNERKVIELKYLERNVLTLERIAERIGYSDRHVRRFHKTALKKLSVSLVMVHIPEIINLDHVIA